VADLAKDTLPEPLGDSRYGVTLSNEWSFLRPSGGVLTTLALRAAALELGVPELRVRSATALFTTALEAGPAHCLVRVLRRGNAASQVHVTVSAGGTSEPGLDVVATFGRDLGSTYAFVDAAPPDVPAPDACPALDAPTPIGRRFVPPIFRNVETRLALGHRWWESEWEAGPARLARWMRYRTPQRLPRGGGVDPLCLPPLVDTMPPSAIQKLGAGFTPFVAPSLDLTVHFLAQPTSDWLLVDTHTRWVGEGYGSAHVHVWDEQRNLVGFATQMWMFRKVPPGTGAGLG
jgi:acyl-CoA thioesterase